MSSRSCSEFYESISFSKRGFSTIVVKKSELDGSWSCDMGLEGVGVGEEVSIVAVVYVVSAHLRRNNFCRLFTGSRYFVAKATNH
jgi:hypothetical protein